MKQEAGLYRLVSEYYEARILNGFYACGENLPSIPKICSVFHMAPATIRAALACLEKSGYIRVDARKAARVVYQAESAGFRENAARYFVPRRDGILDLYQSGQLLFVPLWEAGLRRWEEKDWEELRRDLMDPPAEAVSMPVQFFILALRALDNGLILNLYWEVIRYIRFPYLANREEGHWVRQNLQDLSREEVIALLRGKLETRYRRSVDSLVAYLDRARDEYALEDIAPVPFQWRIYRQRPQLRYTLVSRIIREIYTGVFPGGGYLPSLPQMAERYGVALNTVRRALSVLNCLGLTRSYQGKGTMVCEQPLDGIDVTKPEIRGGLQLFLDSLQILEMTVRQVSLYTLERAGQEKRELLAQRFFQLEQEQKSYLGFELCLAFVERECPLAIVRECYSKLRELLAWGYPFTLRRLKKYGMNREYADTMKGFGQMLRDGQLAGFADGWKTLMTRETEQCRHFLSELEGGH